MKNKAREEKSGRMIHIRLSEDVHRKVRIRAAELDTTIQKWVEATIKKELEKQGK
jgi:predicted HicB family RNase H-like nuclease